MADVHDRGRAVVQVPGRRLHREHRPLRGDGVRVARRGCDDAVVAEAIVVSLFDGEIVAGKVTASVSAGASARSTSAELRVLGVQGLRVLGQDVASAPGSASLGDWGTLTVLSADSGGRKAAPPGAQATTTVLRMRLIAEHGGLPAGSEIVVGSVEATAIADVSAPPRPPSRSRTAIAADARRSSGPTSARARAGRRRRRRRWPCRRSRPRSRPELSSGGFVFPIYGTASFGDSFGGPRPNVPGGWHHGEDIFAPAGTPLLAVADGTLHTIGFNRLGGYRLWLRDTRATSSTTRTSPRTRRSRSRVAACRPGT